MQIPSSLVKAIQKLQDAEEALLDARNYFRNTLNQCGGERETLETELTYRYEEVQDARISVASIYTELIEASKKTGQ